MSNPSVSFTWEECLAHGRRGDVWRVRAPDGTVMVAKQFLGTTPTELAQLRALVRRGRRLAAPVVPFFDLFGGAGDVWLLREYDPGLPLAGLGVESPLSRRQAAGTAAGCLRAIAQLHSAGLCHGRVHAGNVFVEPDGAVRLVDCGIGVARSSRDLRVLQDYDLRATADMVAAVWPDLGQEPGQSVQGLLEMGRRGDMAAACAGLELLAATLPECGEKPTTDLALAALDARLQPDVPGPSTAPKPLRKQRALLSAPARRNRSAVLKRPAAPMPPAALEQPAPPMPPPVVKEPAPPMPPPLVKEPAPPAVAGGSPRHYQWVSGANPAGPAARVKEVLQAVRAWTSATLSREGSRAPLHPTPAVVAMAASLAVGLACVAINIAALPSAHPVGVTSPATHSQPASGGHTPAPPPAPTPGAAVLQPAAPPTAGFVRDVQLQPLTSCQVGGSCSLETTFDLEAPHESTAITWNVVAVDRCTGAETVVQSSTRSVDPSWDVVWATDQYAATSTDPTLLYTVTVSPWRVASSPVQIGDPSACAQRS